MKPNEAARGRAVRKRLWRETLIAARFGLVGMAATVVHILVVSLLLAETVTPPLVANTLAFLTAFSISFTGNYLWTFRSPGAPSRAMRRFLVISVSAFAVNTFILAAILRTGWLPPFYAAIVSAAVVPLITFLASRLWGFQYANGKVGRQDLIPESLLK